MPPPAGPHRGSAGSFLLKHQSLSRGGLLRILLVGRNFLDGKGDAEKYENKNKKAYDETEE